MASGTTPSSLNIPSETLILWRALKVGPLALSQRVGMAPLTRLRSDQPGDAPNDLMVEYYRQRASRGGLVITEATTISITGRGYLGAPGIYSDAQAAGFDDVEVHAGNGYLLDQFLQDGTNRRTDAYGGSVENRTRLFFEVFEAVASSWGADRVGVRVSPSTQFNAMSDSDPGALFGYVAGRLKGYSPIYLHIIEPRIKGIEAVAEGLPPVAAAQLRKSFTGNILAAGGVEQESAEAIVACGDADMVEVGRHFIANPDLPERIRHSLPLNPYDRSAFYGGDSHGYTDYSFYGDQAMA
jgi:2,4-dienoyl-CoA reductase-like NADH-dependent reductase (Old Yellow Enzyme family)